MLSYAYDMLHYCIVYLTLCSGIVVSFIIIWGILLISINCETSKNNLKAYVPASIPSMARGLVRFTVSCGRPAAEIRERGGNRTSSK